MGPMDACSAQCCLAVVREGGSTVTAVDPVIFAHSLHYPSAWVVVGPTGVIACPDRATANRINDLLAEHGMVDVPDSLEGVEWAQ
jgi:hypothetical protein